MSNWEASWSHEVPGPGCRMQARVADQVHARWTVGSALVPVSGVRPAAQRAAAVRGGVGPGLVPKPAGVCCRSLEPLHARKLGACKHGSGGWDVARGPGVAIRKGTSSLRVLLGHRNTIRTSKQPVCNLTLHILPVTVSARGGSPLLPAAVQPSPTVHACTPLAPCPTRATLPLD